MFCAKCGKEIPEGNQYCTSCGTAINSNMAGETPVGSEINESTPGCIYADFPSYYTIKDGRVVLCW